MVPVAIKVYRSDGQELADIRMKCKRGCAKLDVDPDAKPFQAMRTPYRYIRRLPVDKGDYHLHRNPRRKT
jgi:hypothetical protein